MQENMRFYRIRNSEKGRLILKFSIITVSYNASKTICSTVESSLKQTFQDFEIIIKDGLSKDNTISLIPNNDKIVLASQFDKGIYDAMNQAIKIAQGEYLIFLNCGDIFYDSKVLEDINSFIEKNPDIDIVYGDYAVNNDIRRQPTKLTDFYLYRTPLCHQTMVIKRKLFDEMGSYNLEYRILSDYAFTQKNWHYGKKFKYFDRIICKYLGGGVSETQEGMTRKEIERKNILKEYYPKKSRIKYNFILMLSLRKLRIWIMSGNGPECIRTLYKRISNRLNS